MGFLSSYNGEVGGPLVGPQESPVSMRVARCLLGFLSSAYMDLGGPMEFQQGSEALSSVETCKSAFVSDVTLMLDFL